MKLNTKITAGVLSVIVALMTVTSLAVTYIVDHQSVSISHEIIDNAFHAINLELSEMQNEQLSASRQVATIEGIGTDVKYLSKYKEERIPRLTLTTYQRLAEHAYNTAKISGDIWKSAFYDRYGDLLAFSLNTDTGSLLGYVEGYPSAVFHTVNLSAEESLDDKDKYESWQETDSVDEIRLTETIQAPPEGMAVYTMLNGELCIQTVVPIKGLEFNQEVDQLESVTVGFFMAVRRIGEDFTGRMAALTGQPVGIFHKGMQIAGQLTGYDQLLSGVNSGAEHREQATFEPILHNDIEVGDKDYHQGIMRLHSDGSEIASIAVLYSRDLERKNTLQMVYILFMVSLFGILLSIPFVLILTRAITQPITRLRDTMQGIRGGQLGVHVDITSRDVIGDLAASFNKMSDIIKQHNDELEDIVESRTHILHQKTVELEEAKEKAELANKAKSEALRQLGAQRDSLENLVRERTKSLEVANENLSTTLDSIGDGVIVTDMDGKVVRMNPVALNMTGWDMEDAIGKNLSQVLELINADTCKPVDDLVDQFVRTGNPEGLSDRAILVSKNGHEYQIVNSAAPIRKKSGTLIGTVLVFRDITELKEAEARLQDALKQEKAAQIYKDQFLANMSHEIRTPLNGVVGFASLLREEGLDAQIKDEYIKTIESCSTQLLNLVNDIVDVAKIEAGEMKLVPKNFNIANLTRETASTLETIRAAHKGKERIHIKTCIPEGSEDLIIYSDPLRIQQILTNLLSNALKFTNEGMIEFGYEIQDRIIEFFVKDEGIGIAPDRMVLIFQRFEHLEGTAQKYEGTGLGLSISKGLAELLGGTLSVESELGVGSVFRLKIPLHEKAPLSSKEVASSKEEPVKVTSGSYTVLVAEDEIANQRLIKRSLEKTSYRVIFANNGKEALQYYRDQPGVDVVLMDIRMPIMDGLTAAREILNYDPDARIIAQTAYAMREEREEFKRIGLVDYLAKPYRSDQLIEMIEKWALKTV